MNFDDYQVAAHSTAVYPGHSSNGGLVYLALKLNGEAGEVAEDIGKMVRDGRLPCDTNGALITCGDSLALSDEDKKKILLELGDVLWYVSEIASSLGFRLGEVAYHNLWKLRDRAERGTIKTRTDS